MFATIVFAAAKDSGRIKARVSPGDAAIFINGKYAGPASRFTVPESYEAPVGEVEISIRDPRCKDYTAKLTVRPGKTTHISQKLKRVEPAKPPFGTFRLGGGEQEFMSVAAGDVGPVYINGKYYGYVDSSTTRELARGAEFLWHDAAPRSYEKCYQRNPKVTGNIFVLFGVVKM